MGDFIGSLIMIGIWAGMILWYFMPTFITIAKRPSFVWTVLILNLVLGWTCLGWVLLLAFSLVPTKKEQEA